MTEKSVEGELEVNEVAIGDVDDGEYDDFIRTVGIEDGTEEGLKDGGGLGDNNFFTVGTLDGGNDGGNEDSIAIIGAYDGANVVFEKVKCDGGNEYFRTGVIEGVTDGFVETI